MKKLLAVVALMLAAVSAKAEGVFTVNYSSINVIGVNCTTGTPVNLIQYVPSTFGKKIAGVRLRNADSTFNAYIGHKPTLALSGAIDTLGEKIKPDEKETYYVGSDPQNNAARPFLYCIADSGVGTAMLKLSMVIFGQ